MKKAVSKRIRITRTGKLMRRKMGQGHFRANKSGGQIQTKRGGLTVDKADHKTMTNYFSRMDSR